MAAAQKTQSGAAVRALSLLAVLLAAKGLMLAGRQVEASPSALAAFFWQDFLVAICFGLLDWLVLRQSRAIWVLYAATALYVAVNVPVARMMSTPMTWTMLRGARGPLAGSAVEQVSALNLLLTGMVLAIAALAPWVMRRTRPIATLSIAVASATIILLGPAASHRVETLGRDHNAITMLIATALPRVEARGSEADWSASSLADGTDLRQFRGAAKGRNVVVVILESAGARYLKPYGAAEDPMPFLTQLAGQSIVFENAYTVYPESIKGLFASLCSRYPAVDVPAEKYAGRGRSTLADLLAAQGYRTGLFHSGRFGYLGMESLVRDRGFETVEDAGDIGGDRESSFGIDEESTVRRMLAWVDAKEEGRPFFAVYLPVAGHHPYQTPRPGPFPDRDEINRYRNALHYADESLNAVVEGLRERGLWDKTLLVVFGDHGEAFGQHDGNFGHTNFIYEENIHVPYMIAIPGVTGGQTVERVASLIDTPPTIADLLGIALPTQWQGRSLLESRAHMALFLTDYSLGLIGLRDGSWKFIYELDSGRSKLFNLQRDPREERNAINDEPGRAAAYRERVMKWSGAQRAAVASRR